MFRREAGEKSCVCPSLTRTPWPVLAAADRQVGSMSSACSMLVRLLWSPCCFPLASAPQHCLSAVTTHCKAALRVICREHLEGLLSVLEPPSGWKTDAYESVALTADQQARPAEEGELNENKPYSCQMQKSVYPLPTAPPLFSSRMQRRVEKL